MKRIALAVDSLIHFYRMRSTADELQARGAEVDVYVPEDSGHSQSAPDTLRFISEMGYRVFASVVPDTPRYNVLLESYPLSDLPSMVGIEYDYRIKVPYFLLAAKPSSSYLPTLHMPYDAAIAFSRYEANVFQAYGRTHFVAPPNFAKFQRAVKDPDARPRLLYLPTFDDKVSEDYEAMRRSFDSVRSRFHIVVKMHSATQYLESEADHRAFLTSIGDEVLDQSADLAEVLEDIDIVVAGNSAAVFDSLYAEVPVCVVSQDVNRFQLHGDTPLFSFVESGAIPQAKTVSEIEGAIDRALHLREAQVQLKQEQFAPADQADSQLAEVVLAYCATPVEKDPYAQMRRAYLLYTEAQLHAHEQALSWRITAPVRWVLDKLVHRD